MLQAVKEFEGVRFLFDFKGWRSNEENLSISVGNIITGICNSSPDCGILLFFPSYHMKESMRKYWKSNEIDFGINIEEEPNGQGANKKLDAMMERHKLYCQEDKGGSLILAVARGKISEGYDFPDDMARCAIIIGVPFPNVRDPKVVLKSEYYIPESKRF